MENIERTPATSQINMSAGDGSVVVHTLLGSVVLVNETPADHSNAVRSYIDALARFVATPYRTLTTDLPLSEVYVPLRASQSDAINSATCVTELFSRYDPNKSLALLLEGGPGSGKSTIIWHIAQKCYLEPSSVGLGRRYLPLLVRLHCFARARGSSIEARLWEAMCLAGDIAPEVEAPAGYLSAWPDSTGVQWLFLLDGYDEVPAAEQRRVNELLRYLVEKGQNVVLTSRPTSGIPKMLADRLESYVVEPLDECQFSEMATLSIGTRADPLLKAYSECSLRQIEQTPLVASMVLAVYNRHNLLPADRSSLYAEYLSIVWEEARARGLDEELGAISPDLVSLASSCLRQLAYHSTRLWRGTSEIARDSELRELRTSLADFVSTETGKGAQIALDVADRFLEIAGRRSGVFVYRGEYCEWLHPSFREHLSARVLAESLTTDSSARPKELDYWQENEWRYVVMFALALASETVDVDPIVAKILSSGGEGRRFVGEAIVEGARLNRKRRMEVYRALSTDLIAAARVGVCAGILSTPDGELAIPVFSRLSAMPEFAQYYPDTLRAIADIIKADSRSYGPLLLGKLKAPGLLAEIAADTTVPFESRVRSLEAVDGDGKAAAALAMIRDESVTDGARVLKLFKEVAPQLNLEDIARDGSVASAVRRAVPEVLLDSGNKAGLVRLANDETIDLSVRALAAAALVEAGTADEGDESLTQLVFASDPEIAIVLLNRLAETSSWGVIQRLCRRKEQLSSEIIEALFELLNRKWKREMMLDILSCREISTCLRARLLANVAADEATVREFTPIEGELDSFTTAYPKGSFAFLKWRALFSFTRQQFDRALPLLQKILIEEPDSEYVLQACGTTYLALKNFDEAAKLLGRAAETRPFDPHPLRLLGLAHWCSGRYSDAADAFHSSVQRSFLPPEEHELWYLVHYADACYRSGRFTEGLEFLQVHDSVVTRNPELLYIQARLLAANGQFSKASHAFCTLRRLVGDSLDLVVQHAICQRCSGRLAEACGDAERFVRISPQPSPLWFTIAELRLGMGEYQQAAEAVEEVRKEWGSDPYFHYLDACLSLAYGDSTQARNKAVRGLEVLGSASEEVDPLLRRNNSGLLALVAGDQDLALSHFNSLIADETICNGYSVSAKVHLRFYSLPALRDLTTLMPHDDVVRSLFSRLDSLLGKDVEVEEASQAEPAVEEGKSRSEFFAGISRQGYPFPMYCRRYAIGGLYEDKRKAEVVLSWYPREVPIICLWRLEQPERIYGQCNFEREQGDGADFKFCDRIETTATRSLEIFVVDHKVQKLLFVESDLLEVFEQIVRESYLAVRCELVPDEHLLERPMSMQEFDDLQS